MLSEAVDRARSLWRSSELVWGKTDCIMSVADYVRDVTGRDIAAPWRGSYDTQEGAQEIVAQYGGVHCLFQYGMALARFAPCDALSVGCPVVFETGNGAIAGIWTGRRILARLERGAMELPKQIAPIKGAWVI